MIVELSRYQPIEGNKEPILETAVYCTLEDWVRSNRDILNDNLNTTWNMKDEISIRSIIHREKSGAMFTLYSYWMRYDEKKDEGKLIPLTKEEVDSELFK